MEERLDGERERAKVREREMKIESEEVERMMEGGREEEREGMSL